MHSVNYPAITARALQPGDIIGVVAPASPFPLQEMARGLSVLHAMGFATRLAEGLFDSKGFLAGEDGDRVAQLHAMFADDAVRAIICARGGYGALRILTALDYDLLRAHPKRFIGFSDTTALHQAIYLKTGLGTYHGPMVSTLARADVATRESLQHVLLGTVPAPVISDQHRVIHPGRARGVLVGGNLATIASLIGTPFAMRYRGCILFLEETGERPYRIDRMLVQLKLAGSLEGLAGLVLGSFTDCGVAKEIDAIMRQLFDDHPIPIMAGVAAGHGPSNLTLPLGVPAELDVDNGMLHFSEAATVE